MKVLWFNQEAVRFEELDSKSIIGVEFSNKRSFVVKVEKDYWVCSSLCSNHGYTAKIRGTSIANLLSKVNDKKAVYLFESYKELGAWFTEKL